MAVRESLELDLRAALASLSQLDRQLLGSARQFSSELARGVGNIQAGTGLATVTKQTNEAADASKKAALSAKEHEAALSSLGTKAGIAGAAIAAGIGLAIKASIDFEKELSNVAAVSGATNKQLGLLEDAAIKAGAATVFSASDAARAESELAKAGLSVRDILGGALTGSLNLASAGQLDLAESARIAAQAMQIFNLQGSDVSHIADVLAAGANKSTASVSSLGEGLGNAGGAARLAGLSLEETVGVLALLDQNAVRGAEGGTALRSALLALFTPSKIQRDEMTRLGLAVFDAGGKFIGLSALAGELQTKLGGLTDAQRNASLGIIFGTFGIQAATALYKEGADGVQKYTNAVNDNGAAQRFAARQLDNLAGDLEQLKGSIETALIKNGAAATQSLRFLAQGATDFTNSFAGLPGPLQAAGGGVAALAAAALLGFAAFAKFGPTIKLASEQIQTMPGATGEAVRGFTKLAGVTAGLAIGAASFQSIGDSAAGTTVGLLGMAAAGATLGASLGGVQGAAIGAGIGLGVGLAKGLEGAIGKVGELDIAIDTLARSSFSNIKTMISDGIALASALGDVPDKADLAKNAIASLGEVGKSNLGTASRLGRAYVELGIITEGQLTKAIEKAAAGQRQANSDLAAGAQILGGVTAATEETTKAYEDFLKALNDGTPTIKSMFDTAVEGSNNLIGAFDPALLIEQFNKQSIAIANFTSNIRTLLDQGLTDLAADLVQKGPLAAAPIAQAFVDAGPGIGQAAEDAIDFARGVNNDYINEVNSNFAPRFQAAGTTLGFNLASGTKSGIDAGKPAVLSAADQMRADTLNAIGAAGFGAYAIGVNIAESTASGIRAGTVEAIHASEAMAASIAQAAAGAIEARSPSKVFIRLGRSVGEGWVAGMEQSETFVGRAGRRLALRTIPSLPGGGGAGSGAVDNSFNVGGVTVVAPTPTAAARQTVARMRIMQEARR